MTGDAPGNGVPLDSGLVVGGRYLLGELLGVGGSASVFAAVDRESGSRAHRVAVKLLHPHLCATDDARRAFLDEAHRAAELAHPAIAAVYASGVHDGAGVTMAWIALELVEGGNLSEHVAGRGPLPVPEAAAVVGAVLGALTHAHDRGLVHRDISPSNILLRTGSGDGPIRAEDVRLADFGLADLPGRDTRGGDVLRTTTGEGVIGNANYLSPEQAQGLPVTASGDLYQAGAVLYFVLTGQVPYPRASRALTAQAHVSAPPPVPSAVVPAARPLDRVVTRAMAKDPAARYPDAGAFRTAVGDALAATRRLPVAPAAAGAAGNEHTQVTRMLPASLHPAMATAAPPPATAPVGASRTGPTVFVLVAVLIVAAVIAITTWGAGSAAEQADPDPSVSASETPTPEPAEEPVAEPTAESTPEATTPGAADLAQITVPELDGTLTQAQASLARLGLALGRVTRADSPLAEETVISQTPAAGETLGTGGTVDVTIASGSNTVPDVAGLDVAAAVAVIRSSGFTAGATGATGATVTGTSPAAGASAVLGTTVTLTTTAATSTPGPTAASPGEG